MPTPIKFDGTMPQTKEEIIEYIENRALLIYEFNVERYGVRIAELIRASVTGCVTGALRKFGVLKRD
jgi:hypothetical protein